MRLKPGLITLSKAPRRNRRAIRLAKLDTVPWHARIMAQKNIVPARYFPMGSFTKPMEPGRDAVR